MVLQVLFWLLLLLCVIGAFLQDSLSPFLVRGRWVMVLILIAILGYVVFGNPIHR